MGLRLTPLGARSSARSCSYQGGVHLCALAKARMIARLVNMLRRRRARDLVLVAALVALGGAALADVLRDRTAEEARDGRAATAATTDEREASATTAEEAQDGQTPTTTTDEGEASVPRLPGGAASGLLAFTAPGACELRAIDLRSAECSTSLGWRRIASFTPRASGRASRTACPTTRAVMRGTSAFSTSRTRGRASASTRGGLSDRLGPGRLDARLVRHLRVRVRASRGQRPKRLDQCPWAYDPSGATASVNDRQQIVIGGRPLLRARGPIWELAWGVDGSLAVLVEGGRVDRYEGGRLVGAASVPTITPDRTLTYLADHVADLAPDNCAALSVSGDVVRLIDLGCFQGRAPRTFKGVYADWSPNGKWIAVAEPDAVVFHRVVGREASVRWDVVAGQLAWLSG